MPVIIDDFLVAGGIYLAIKGIGWCYHKWQTYRIKSKNPELFQTTDLTDADRDLIYKSREIMHRYFDPNITDRMTSLSLDERKELFRRMVEDLNATYGLNITDIEFLSADEIGQCTFGYYNFEENSIRFNADILGMNQPEEVVREMVDTVFHEMRHALQYRAVTDSTCTYGDPEQLRLWALNFATYIPARVDFALYQMQVIEADARQFAELIIKDF